MNSRCFGFKGKGFDAINGKWQYGSFKKFLQAIGSTFLNEGNPSTQNLRDNQTLRAPVTGPENLIHNNKSIKKFK